MPSVVRQKFDALREEHAALVGSFRDQLRVEERQHRKVKLQAEEIKRLNDRVAEVEMLYGACLDRNYHYEFMEIQLRRLISEVMGSRPPGTCAEFDAYKAHEVVAQKVKAILDANTEQ